MTGFLASVQSLQEAELALGQGVDIIDLKSPADGVLGAVPAHVQREVVAYVRGRRPVSATVGDLPALPELLQCAVAATEANGVDLVKVGFFEPSHRAASIAALAPAIARGARIVAVLFADREPDPLDVLVPLAGAGFMGVMLDTADKVGSRLRGHLSDVELGGFVERARRLGLVSGLAGRLEVSDIAPLLSLGPDYLGFRGALCGEHRDEPMDPERVRMIRARIPPKRATIALKAEHLSVLETVQATTAGGVQWLGE